jgi:hypothetical protein
MALVRETIDDEIIEFRSRSLRLMQSQISACQMTVNVV